MPWASGILMSARAAERRAPTAGAQIEKCSKIFRNVTVIRWQPPALYRLCSSSSRGGCLEIRFSTAPAGCASPGRVEPLERFPRPAFIVVERRDRLGGVPGLFRGRHRHPDRPAGSAGHRGAPAPGRVRLGPGILALGRSSSRLDRWPLDQGAPGPALGTGSLGGARRALPLRSRSLGALVLRVQGGQHARPGHSRTLEARP